MLIWVTLIISIFISIFLFFDEEPLFDLTDFNISQIVIIIFCLWSIVWENNLRAKYGQFLNKDRSLLFSFCSYWFVLENYVYATVIIFCFHSLSPLESELFESVEVSSALLVWFSHSFLPFLFVSILLYTILNFFSYNISWFNTKFFSSLSLFVFVALVILFFFLLFDFLFNSLTSYLIFSELLSYNNSSSSLSYNHFSNEFDWHKTKKTFFIFRFEDLYIFFIQLLNLVSLFTFLIIYFFFLLDIYFCLQVGRSISYFFLGTILSWFNNFIFKLFLSIGLLLVVSLKIVFKILIEFNFFLF